MEVRPKQDHEYREVNLIKEISQIDYENWDVKWGPLSQDSIEIIAKIGRGKYSNVFEAMDMDNKRKVALKILNPIRKSKIKRQIFILNQLKHPSIVQLISPIRCSLEKTTGLVFQYTEHEQFRTLYPKLSLQDIKHYTRELFKALDYIHSQGIIHRDIKPHNILINPEKRTLKIIDFGLAEFYLPDKQFSSKVYSLYYKPPELILGSTFYDYSADVWAAGLILAGMIFKRTPFVQGSDHADQIYKLSKILGTDSLISYCRHHVEDLTECRQFRQQLLFSLANPDSRRYPPSDLTEFINKKNEDFAVPEALDLLRKLLKLEHTDRITAKDALKHPFLKV